MMASQSTDPSRKPYTGSCHCGAIKYITYLTLPFEPLDPAKPWSRPCQIAYRCNCTACHKMGIMHLRLANAPDDFALLSPLTLDDLGDYRCQKKRLRWLFCKTCGVRCFTLGGPVPGKEGEVVEEELLGVTARGEKTQYWRLKKETWNESIPSPAGTYLSLNALTLDAGQEGLDLRQWVEKKAILYIDCLELNGAPRGGMEIGRPQVGGCY